MKVFISWSGELSKNLAEILKQWLPAVIQAVKPYYSPYDIEKGARWNTEISKELEESKVGLICLTRDSLEAPWIMFETGALSKNIDKSKVCPILFGITQADIQGPLVQFQAASFEKDEIKKVVKMINGSLGEACLAPDVIDSVFEMWWPKLSEKVTSAMKQKGSKGTQVLRPERDILEEVLRLTRIVVESRNHGAKSIRISPHAILDLAKKYRDITLECKSLGNGRINTLLQELQRPIEYLVARVELPQPLKEEVYDYLSTATSLLEDTKKSKSEPELEMGDEDEMTSP